MRQKLAFCSIATSEYLGPALACLRSLHELHPQAELHLLAVDGFELPAEACHVQCKPLQDCIPADTLQQMRQRYSVAELCFAAKPYLMQRLLVGGADQVHYLDADCIAFASLESLVRQLDQADVLLTPHSLAPIPDDGLTPRPLTLLRAGVFNAGYISVRNTAEGLRFTQWWCAMTAVYGSNNPKAGMCGDQRWLDPVPVLFPGSAICRQAGANVAYWNLHERRLERDAQGRFLVNGQPLLFFHFSGYRAEQPLELSQYQNRHAAPEGSALALLLGEYRSRLGWNTRSEPDTGWWRKLWRLAARA